MLFKGQPFELYLASSDLEILSDGDFEISLLLRNWLGLHVWLEITGKDFLDVGLQIVDAENFNAQPFIISFSES